ncbi:hypothetical protein [Arthrobacter globiformis]|uniref:hypothetical protein n=1 Tax=Arthrobacter globiformis TaxID=1665 RepID=UPI002787B672|nr:hypothetical protein [Arthrobacter globiformis]MDQ0867277.1 hypothetical protein [Arthrobacter globiformis]
MNINLAAFLMSLLAGLAIHLFFKVMRRHGPAGQGGAGQRQAQTAYLSVSDYVANTPRRRLYYVAFRHLPPLIVTMLLCGLLNKLFPELWTLPYLLAATFSSVLFGSFRESLRRDIYVSERLVHIYNVVVVNLMAVLTEPFSHSLWLAAVTPSLEGIVDNIWSSLFVSLIVIAFLEFSSQKHSASRGEERRDTTERFVAASLSSIEAKFGSHVDALCGDDLLLRRLMRAILVFEDMNRPAWIRLIERLLVRLPGISMTVGVAQVSSDRPLSDFDSITLAHKLLVERSQPGCSSAKHADEEERLNHLIGTYNPNVKYLQDVMSVYRLVPVG